MNRPIICVTGHRPNKLYGYDLNHPKWQDLKARFKEELVKDDACWCISGMALGVDTIFAMAVLELKDEGYDIKLCCAIPCLNHSSNWFESSKKQYEEILQKSDDVRIITEAPYSPHLMQVRNEYMVQCADKVYSVWNGTPGGTKNCIDYAKSLNRPIYNFYDGHFL